MSYLSGEIDLRGDVSEPEVPEDTIDLSNVLLKDLCGAILALPFIVCIQLSSMCDCCARFMLFFQREPRTIEEEAERQERIEARMDQIRNFNVRAAFESLFALISVPGKRSRAVVASQDDSDEEAPPAEDPAALRGLRERERDAADAVAVSLLPEPLEELEVEFEGISPILSVQQFKALWPALGVAGSFQCKLKSAPNMQILTTHLLKQNFNVVFASSPSDKETEVSICNIKESPGEAWFMARFLFTSSLFSAVMKAQDSDVVQAHVRRFALAKVLKIDTSA
ncbi:unnamed protein product [Symbiodinium microadriaticum]|nr:unnamed protein product [Symbiodinium microadriaticum]